MKTTLPEVSWLAPAKWWLEDDPFLLGRELVRGELLSFGGVIEQLGNLFQQNNKKTFEILKPRKSFQRNQLT